MTNAVAREARPSSVTDARRGNLLTRDGRLGIHAALFGALVLRLWELGRNSIWTDEGSTWTAATSPLPALIRLCAEKDASPPLFYLLTSLALRLEGSEFGLRLVSALASTAIVWLTYRIARLALSRHESAFAASFTALSPFQLMFAQEARTYALVAAFTVASLYFFLRAAVWGRRRSWIWYVIASTLALYTQTIAVLGFGVQAAIAILQPEARRRIGAWLLALGATVVLFLPWLWVSVTQMSRLSSSHWYVHRPDAHGVFQVLRAVFLTPIPIVSAPAGSHFPGLDAWLPRALAHGLLMLIVAIPLAASIPSMLERSERGRLVRLVALALVLPLVAVFAVSFRTPLWLPRYFVFLTPFYAVLLSRGVDSLKPSWLAKTAMLLLVFSNEYACLHYFRNYTKENWRDTVYTIAAKSPAARTAVLVPFDVDPFRFYNVRLARPLDAYEVSHPEVPFSSSWTPDQLTFMERRAGERSESYDDVWVVIRSPNSPVRRELADRTLRAAAEGRRRVEDWTLDSVGGPVRAVRFRRGE